MYVSKKERDLSFGYNYLLGDPRAFRQFAAALLAPFAVTIEVFVRKEMGERYFTYSNFITGLIVLVIFRVIYFLATAYGAPVSGISGYIGAINWFYIIFLCYVGMSVFHFMYQWYLEAVERPIFSHYMGDSRLFFLGKIILKTANGFFSIIVGVFSLFLSDEEKELLKGKEVEFTNYRAFTYQFVEPFTVILLGWYIGYLSFLLMFWLMISGAILAIHSSSYLKAERDQFLDIRDGKIFASQMELALNDESKTLHFSEQVKETIRSVADEIEKDPEEFEQMKKSSPSVADALANLNPNLKNL